MSNTHANHPNYEADNCPRCGTAQSRMGQMPAAVIAAIDASCSTWCCTDCIMLFANGETPPELDEDGTAEFLASIDRRTEGCHVAVGGAHDEDCTNDGSEDCGCETRDFSWSSCGTCGSPLGGSRHAVTLFASTSAR